MSSFDNEIYRGPPEAGPTLEHDLRSYGSDVYIVKAEKNTLAQDVPPTEEPVRQEAKPVQKKESKIAKAMKLLASCTAAVTIAANLTVPPAPPPPVEEPTSHMQEWPSFSPLTFDGRGFSFTTISENGQSIQAATGSKSYRITAKQEDLSLFWHTTYDTDYATDREGFCIMMEHQAEQWHVEMNFHLYPQTETWGDDELLGQFTTASGETLYLRAMLLNIEDHSIELLQHILDHLSDYIEITEATEDGWGKVLIGNTMYSDINAQWNGILTTPDVKPTFCFSFIHTSRYNEHSEENFIRSMTVNGIEWRFYYSIDEYSVLLWAVPSQEDIVLGTGLDYLPGEMGLSLMEIQYGSEETQAALMDHLGIAVELAVEHCFRYYHLYDAAGRPPVYFPEEVLPVPDDTSATNPADTLPMPTDPGTIHFDYFDANIEFTIGDRSFLMLNWRDDVLLRQHYTGEDHVQIDLATTDGQLRVNLIVGTSPNGGEYLSYPLENGMELYTAVFNHWGDPWTYDSTTLLDLNQNLSSYVRIIETTVYDEIVETTEPDPYSSLPEYVQYTFTPDGMSYSTLARSNRVCQFVTGRGKYRMEAQSPDVFIFWENYSYDIKDESGQSFITVTNLAESWSMGLWVFDEAVDSIYEGFSLTAEDGTELWFYISYFDDYTGADRREAAINSLPDLVKLTAPVEDGWGKLRMGETMLVEKSRHWNGTAYTVSWDDYWFFEEIIDASTFSENELRHAGTRYVNGIQWDFYSYGNPSGPGMTPSKDFYYTRIIAAPAQENLYFITSATYGLTLDVNEFSSQAEYESYIDANIDTVINAIVTQGLSNFYPYSE